MSLDAHTLDLEELRYGLSNVTCLRIFDHSDSVTKSYLADWKVRQSSGVKIPRQTHEITVSHELNSHKFLLFYFYKCYMKHFSLVGSCFS